MHPINQVQENLVAHPALALEVDLPVLKVAQDQDLALLLQSTQTDHEAVPESLNIRNTQGLEVELRFQDILVVVHHLRRDLRVARRHQSIQEDHEATRTAQILRVLLIIANAKSYQTRIQTMPPK